MVACFEHRRYTGRDATGRPIYWSGAEFRPDVGGRIINWPHQHYERGVAKNKVTGERFKFLTRAMKRLRNEMADQGIAEARPIASYLIECLLYNVPNELFGSARYMDDIRQVLIHTFSHTRSDDECHQWLEVSELKWLFWSGQPWTRQAANAFIGAAWRHVGFT